MRLGPGMALAVTLLGGVAGCKKQPYRGVRPDAGAAVVVVERKTPRARDGGTIEVPLVDEKEPDDALGMAQPIEYLKGIRGTLAAAVGGRSDVDVYQWLVGGEGKQAARIEVSSGMAERISLEALDGDGAALVPGEAGGGVVTIPNLAVEAGRTYYLRVTDRRKPGAVPAGAVAYALVVRAEPLATGDEEEPNDTLPRAGTVTLGGDERGYFGRSHDEDVLRLPDGLPDAGTLRIDLVVPPAVSASLRMRDAAGKVVAKASGGRGEELQLRNAPPLSAGSITLRAESGHDVDARWRLHLDGEPRGAGEEVEPNNDVKSATPIELAGEAASCAGFLWPSDADAYRVRVPAAGALEVTVAGPEGVHLKLERLREDGHAMGGGEGKGARASLRFGAAPGDVFVRVSARPQETVFDAPYVISVSLHAVDGGTPAP